MKVALEHVVCPVRARLAGRGLAESGLRRGLAGLVLRSALRDDWSLFWDNAWVTLVEVLAS